MVPILFLFLVLGVCYAQAGLRNASCNGSGTEFLVVLRNGVNFDEADRGCRNEFNGRLARIDNLQDFNLVDELMRSFATTESFWIGLRDSNFLDNSGTDRFSYIDGTGNRSFFDPRPANDLPWISGQPSDSCKFLETLICEDCVEWNFQAGGWNDEDCGQGLGGYVCRRTCNTGTPTLFPTDGPTNSPTLTPTVSPTFAPTKSPTTTAPTTSPTVSEGLFDNMTVVQTLFLSISVISVGALVVALLVMKKEKTELRDFESRLKTTDQSLKDIMKRQYQEKQNSTESNLDEHLTDQ